MKNINVNINIPDTYSVTVKKDFLGSLDNEFNIYRIKTLQTQFNDRLFVYGHVFLNELFDAIDLPKTAYGQIVGWALRPIFLYDPKNAAEDPLINIDIVTCEDTYILTFNVQGIILNELESI